MGHNPLDYVAGGHRRLDLAELTPKGGVGVGYRVEVSKDSLGYLFLANYNLRGVVRLADPVEGDALVIILVSFGNAAMEVGVVGQVGCLSSRYNR